MAKVLLVEDQFDFAQLLSDALTHERYVVDVARTAADAAEFLIRFDYDLIILDWHLPDGDGVSLCRQFRKTNQQTPVLMLTAFDTIQQKITGLDCGASDYVTKPVDTQELLARMRALLRRSADQEERLELGDLIIDRNSRTAMVVQRQLALTAKEFDLLEFLVDHPETDFDAESLRARIWGPLSDVSKNAVMTTLSRLRSKIGESRTRIETNAIGYRITVK